MHCAIAASAKDELTCPSEAQKGKHAKYSRHVAPSVQSKGREKKAKRLKQRTNTSQARPRLLRVSTICFISSSFLACTSLHAGLWFGQSAFWQATLQYDRCMQAWHEKSLTGWSLFAAAGQSLLPQQFVIISLSFSRAASKACRFLLSELPRASLAP